MNRTKTASQWRAEQDELAARTEQAAALVEVAFWGGALLLTLAALVWVVL